MHRILKAVLYFFFKQVARIHLRLLPLYERACGRLQFEGVGACGTSLSIEGKGILLEKNNVSLGNHIFIGRNFFIRAAGGVSIGDYTHISRNVTIHTVNHNMNGRLLPYDREDIMKPVVIGRYVWIGMNVNILPGVVIGDGAVIGMGTTVSRDVSENSIVVGCGQRVIGHRSEEKTALLVKNNSFLKNRT